MRVYNTRFNPTVNGPLHIGHLYMIKINEAVAHDHGGTFTVRLDNTQRFYHLTRSESELSQLTRDMVHDILWTGVTVDRWTYQSEMAAQVHSLLLQFNNGPLPPEIHESFQECYSPDITVSKVAPFPYAPQFTAEKVIMDAVDYITWLIRGDDLINEFSLYTWFCDIWHLHRPEHVYLPRLMLMDNKELSENTTNISKTRGGYTIQEFREKGWTADDLQIMLADACLKCPARGWSLENLKENPTWPCSKI